MRALSVLASLTVASTGSKLTTTSKFSPMRPPAVPLAVSSPYLNTWLDADTLPGNWPVFWAGAVTGWQGFISVDGTAYNWMGGAPGPSLVTQTSVSYTSTRSIFTFDVAGKVQLTVTFLSPVYPDDLIKKSLQFSYVETSVVAKDGGKHDISVYVDVSGEWMSGDRSATIKWDTGTQGAVQYHTFWNPAQVTYQEIEQQANWGSFLFATTASDGMTYQIGADTAVRDQFTKTGVLNNTVDTTYRAINIQWPVFAYAHHLGAAVGADAVTKVFGIGISQVQTIKFQGATLQNLTGPWHDKWAEGTTAMADWVNGYQKESAYSTTIDNRVQNDAAAAGGESYAALTSLAVRQAFAALQPAKGATQTYLFLKEISSNGDIQTVDVIFPATPILYYFNPSLVKLLLDPLFENQETPGNYPNTYAIHDLGTFPNALGYPAGNDEEMPVEECGNMLIMVLAYAQRTGDTAYLMQHYSKLEQWTGYLVKDSLIPANQLSTDDFAGKLANQTNLALKGIIGIAAFGAIQTLTGHTDTHTRTAQSYIDQWYDYGINPSASPPHTVLSYGDRLSWGLLYNLYGDRLLGLKLVKQSVYDQQDAFYPTVMDQYGVPLDTRHKWTKLDWECWVAAISSQGTRDAFYKRIFKWLSETTTRVPLTDWYYATDGTSAGFLARPVVGGVFAELALDKH